MRQRRSYNIQQLKDAVTQSECWSDVCRKVNVTVCTFNFRRIQELCKTNNIDYNHFNIKKTFRRNKKNWDSADVYKKNSLFPRSQLRQKILKEGWLPYFCRDCKIDNTWNGKPLTLEIEHINGINDDNRKENLTWLCPNCHSQTNTYRNSNNRRAGSLEAKSGVLITPGS
jgi:hypothetical protein